MVRSSLPGSHLLKGHYSDKSDGSVQLCFMTFEKSPVTGDLSVIMFTSCAFISDYTLGNGSSQTFVTSKLTVEGTL